MFSSVKEAKQRQTFDLLHVPSDAGSVGVKVLSSEKHADIPESTKNHLNRHSLGKTKRSKKGEITWDLLKESNQNH